jgi:hypothetical protein
LSVPIESRTDDRNIGKLRKKHLRPVAQNLTQLGRALRGSMSVQHREMVVMVGRYAIS